MKKNKISDEGDELAKKYHKLDEIKFELHDLLKKIVIKTDVGEIYDDYTDTVELYLGDLTIYSCGYYNQLALTNCDGKEFELDHDLETTKKIYLEVRKRYNQLVKMNELKRAKLNVEELFEKPFDLEVSGE